jgi:hypothetical protein
MLVVVGSILIAFSLDAWWDERADKRVEAAHLRALRSDFEQNVTRLTELIAQEEQIADASRRLLLAATSSHVTSLADSTSNLLGQVFNSSRYDPVMGAYEAVVSSGGLDQVQDDSLRLALADFASLAEGRYYERFSDQLYFDFVRSYTGQLGFSAAVVATDSSTVRRGTVTARQVELVREPKFREHLALRYLAERDVARGYRGLLAKAQTVLDLTRRALGEDRP